MGVMERINEPTPNGGDYSEVHYLDEKHNEVPEDEAKYCIIRELKNDGTLVNEIQAIMD